jgi:Zn finger protein HypA/HybF involved in hydrogenase expression
MSLAAVLFLLAAVAGAERSDCGGCHRAQTSSQIRTPMARALESIRDCAILRSHSTLEFHSGEYSYSIRREGERSLYAVTNGKETITAPIGWAFGLGAAGQTYIFEREGALYESRVSFYNALNGLDLTMGAANAVPRNLDEAAGRKLDGPTARACFDCHSTGAVRGATLSLNTMEPGVQCERCHGPATLHAAAMKAGDSVGASLPKLSKLTTEEVSDLCGGCHRTWADITTNGPRGVANVRFQPYRLTNSKCYDAVDRRIACTSCHNPHQHASADQASYDAKCQTCHSRANAAAKLCRVADRNCVSCHMPKIELPGAHFAFTDHQIRIARQGAPYPN